ncbi:hypothetical protein [Methylorubrum populi]|uniref:Uncharacterized protein n=1 Tax=Methylorubrum populi TaxID=223967 RepID=A0A833JAT6_9HYPH|nr:hypothetical protein [Methylorubrum populi]KAB7788004.1 hypothetical protein F8B43_0009 [Methylorubrum populi]
MTFAPIWLGALAAILAQRSAVVGVEQDERLVVAALCGCLLAAGSGLLLLGWASA